MNKEEREALLREALAVATSAGPRPKEYRKYDFTRPDKLSNEQKRLLRNQFEPVCRLFCINFGTALRTVVEMWLIDVDEIRYRDVFEEPYGDDDKSLAVTFNMGPDQPQGLVQVSITLMFAILELMMGGTGFTPMPDKDLTEFEKNLFARLLLKILGYYAKTFMGEELTPNIERMETEAALIPRTHAPEESMVRQIFRISINNCVGHVVVSLPFEFFRPRLPQLRNTGTNATAPLDPSRAEELGVVEVPLMVELGRSALDLRRLMALRPGDHFELGGRVTVRVGDVPKFHAKPGLVDERVAVEILSPVVFEDLDDI